jgi:predicted nucleic acid-binding protein
MPIDRVVVNASPLIILAKTGHAVLLPRLFDSIVLPYDVVNEIRQTVDDASRLIDTCGWLEQMVVTVSPDISGWNLGDGETAVLSFALDNPGIRASIDDRAARRCAEALSIPTIGTIGILLLAKRRGLIDSARAAIGEVRSAGLYVSDELVESLLKEVESE